MADVLEKAFRRSQWFRAYPFCHSRPDRSFRYKGRYFGLCARCTAMYLSGLAAMLTYPLWGGLVTPIESIVVGLLLLVPTAIDGTTQMFGTRESTNRLRVLTGAPLGVGVVAVMYGVVFGFAFG